jgi:hypothetical protein
MEASPANMSSISHEVSEHIDNETPTDKEHHKEPEHLKFHKKTDSVDLDDLSKKIAL